MLTVEREFLRVEARLFAEEGSGSEKWSEGCLVGLRQPCVNRNPSPFHTLRKPQNMAVSPIIKHQQQEMLTDRDSSKTVARLKCS
eukprot:m.229060 g.229060  ORF g.229060 m.229060 type:complete len:85 (-) comp54257_c0_seq2:1526-1780(-)